MSQREMRVLCYGLLEEIDRLPQIRPVAFIPEKAASQVNLIRLGTSSGFRSDSFPLRAGKLCLQSLRDRAGNIAFDREDVCQLAIVSLCPKVCIIARID